MLSHIIGVRESLHILNTAFTVIQIRKALNSIYHRVFSRGSLLIYAQAYKATKFNHGSVYTFVTSWLPGLISNYKQVAGTLAFHRKIIPEYGHAFFSRPQLDALSASKTEFNLQMYKTLFDRLPSRYAKIPSISLSVLDDFVWLNECHNLGIPSIQICDTQSFYDLITYPIVSNQRSVPFTYLLIQLFSEICNHAIMTEHFQFANYVPSEIYLNQFIRRPEPIYHRLARRDFPSHVSRFEKSYLLKYKVISPLVTYKNKTHLSSLNRFRFVKEQRIFVYNEYTYYYQIKDILRTSGPVKLEYNHLIVFNVIINNVLYYLNLIRLSYRLYIHLKYSLPYYIYRDWYKPYFYVIYGHLKELTKTFIRKREYPRSYFTEPFTIEHLKLSSIVSIIMRYNDLLETNRWVFHYTIPSVRYIRFISKKQKRFSRRF